MKLRTALAIAILPLVVVALAACAAQPKPVPTLSAAQKCTPKTATIQWMPKSSDADATTPARVTILDYSVGNGGYSVNSIYVARPVSMDFDASVPPKFFSSTSEATWKAALLSSVRLTGQVDPSFGRKITLPPQETKPTGKHGKFLVNDEVGAVILPFSVKCAGQNAVDGTLSGPVDDFQYTVIVGCDQKAVKHDVQQELDAIELAKQYCKTA